MRDVLMSTVHQLEERPRPHTVGGFAAVAVLGTFLATGCTSQTQSSPTPDPSRTAAIVTVQYREGFADAPARLVAEREAIRGSLAASRALTDQRHAVVGVYRALGGGW